MKNNLMLLFAAAMLLSACGGNNKPDIQLMDYIPADAVMVTHLNAAQLYNKANSESIKKMPFYQNLIKRAKPDDVPKIEALVQNPEETGIALRSIYVYQQVKKIQGTSGKMEMLLLLPLKDKAKWEQFAQNLCKHFAMPFEIKNKDEINYLRFDTDHFLAWNEQMICLQMMQKQEGEPDWAGLFGKKEKSIANTKEFSNLDPAKRDVLVWVNPDALIDATFNQGRSGREYQGFLFLIGLSPDMLKGSHFAAWYDFENGAIKSGVHYRFNEALRQRFGGFFKDALETDFAPYLPKQNLAAVQTVAVNPEKVADYVRQNRMEMPADIWLSQYGFNVDVLAEGLGGDIITATYVPSEEALANGGGLDFAMGFSLKKADFGERFLNFVASFMQAQVTKMGNGQFALTQKYLEVPIFATLSDKMLLLSTRKDILDQAAKGGFAQAERADNSYMSVIQSGWFGMHIDHQAAIGGSIGALGFGLAMTKVTDPAVADILSDYDEALSTTLSCKKEDATISIQLKTKDRNSLQRLLEMSSDMYDSLLEINELQ